jgi:two-component sensor histidine kinase
MYKDNGPGLPVTVNPSKTKSMGLRLISRLSVQIGGRANFIPSKGLCCEIVFSAIRDKA